MSADFIHLRVHSEYSLINGIVRIKDLVSYAAQNSLPAIALTDHMNLFGMVKFYKHARASGVKPIIGCDVLIATEDSEFILTLLCQNNIGYKNLTKLISRAYIEGQSRGTAYIKYEWLTKDSVNGLLAIINEPYENKKNTKISSLLEIFTKNNLFLAISKINNSNNILPAVEYAKKYQIPLVAVNNVCFFYKNDFIAHEARVCIHDGYVLDDPKRPKKYTEEQYLKSSKEMQELFAEIPSAIENTAIIAKRCNVTLELGKNYLPNYPTPDNLSIEKFLELEAKRALDSRLRGNDGKELRNDGKELGNDGRYLNRLIIELGVINSMGFAGYFLIVADFIRWAKENDIPVGPGRGSGAGSLVAYALGITDIDPLPYDLLFERFLNPERVSMPDFDIDFCMDGRDRVIHYVAEKYGKQAVSQIITFGTMAAKAVIRDVGRVMGMPYGFVDAIAKLIPFEIGMTLDKALVDSESLKNRYDSESEVAELIDLAKKLEGVARNAGKHAGGVVIAPSELTDFAPLYCEEGSESIVTQFDKDDVEAVGLVKFDFLGLRNLTIIHNAVKTIPEINNINDIPLNCPKTFKLLQSCNTTAVFQLESSGMKELIKRLQPDCFEDIIALVALYRPGPLQSGMVDDYINRKHGRAKVEYSHPLLEPVLKPTYGVILYQEQVMQIAQNLAGYSLGAADLLRRAMGKKKPEEMAKQREIFLDGAQKNNIDSYIAGGIFDLMEKFAGYGFNKSHSAAYALVSYQTSWLKAHFPEEFMAAVLSSDMDNTDKIEIFINNCWEMKMEVLPPSVNYSDYRFSVCGENKIRYGLGAIKGVGHAAIESILDEQKVGPFKDLFEFCSRVDLRRVNKKVLEALIYGGAFDCFGKNRATLFASIASAMSSAEQYAKSSLSGQQDLFSLSDSDDNSMCDYCEIGEWDKLDELKLERSVLGVFLTGHPLKSYADNFKKMAITPITRINAGTTNLKIAGIISSLKLKKTKTGKRMQIITLEDMSGKIEFVLFDDNIEKYQNVLLRDNIVVIRGKAVEDKFRGGVRLNPAEIINFKDNLLRQVKAIELKLTNKILVGNKDIVNNIKKILANQQKGDCNIFINYSNGKLTTKIEVGRDFKIKLTDLLISELNSLLGKENIVELS